ncbi:MAG: hypothetical protein A2Z72_04660 [Omnitrophica bacterium RBG_13_46_9]|nr:MAG: hypothetical protein A2Z72_04660 [Omnitrophica bacterium RBG_13_46_9]
MIALLLIISSYIVNNILWVGKSPIYFYRDSIMNISWAVYYGKAWRNEKLAYGPDLIEVLNSNNINPNGSIYYYDGSPGTLKGLIAKKENITTRDLLKFYHPPLWFMFLGSLFFLFGFRLWVIYLAQFLLGATTIGLTYLVGKRLFSSTAGLLSAFILSTLPSFLIITRQGFLETMICPLVLIGVILVDYILKYPLGRFYYILLGLVCGIGMLIKSTFILYIVIFFLVIVIFADKKEISLFSLLKIFFLALILIILIALPWYAYACQSFLAYSNMGIAKGRSQYLFDTKNFFVIFAVLKNVQLGSVLFVLFVIAAIRSCVKPKLYSSYLIFFLICGYLLKVFLPFAVIIRHFSPFLPLVIILICCSIVDLYKFKRWVAVSLVIFSFIRGYGWMVLPLPCLLDQMSYFYDDIGTKSCKHLYSNYATDVKSGNLVSSFAPLNYMQQRVVYDEIKKVPSSTGLRLVKIISPSKHILEAKTLAGALSLYSIFDGFPLIIEDPHLRLSKPFKDRIWVFLNSSNKDMLIVNKIKMKLGYIATVPLLPAVKCDIFIEYGND